MSLDAEQIAHIAALAHLAPSSAQRDALGGELSAILDLIEQMQAIDTEGVEPMRHPFDYAQPLRADEITEQNQRDTFQVCAPRTERGLYLVPKVIE